MYESKIVGGAKNFEIAPKERGWDGTKAEKNIRKWASSDGSGNKEKIDWAKYKKAFSWYDPNDKENFGAYKMAFVDIVNGNPKAVFRALSTIVAVLNGAREGVDIPDNDKKAVYRLMQHYYKKFDEEPPELRGVYVHSTEDLDSPGQKKYMELPFEIKAGSLQEDGTFEGYASMFKGGPDDGGDVVLPGAFIDSISKGGRNGNGVPMLWQHKSDQIPGIWTQIVEDGKGLYVKGQLALNTQLGREAYELLKLGAIKGMSIGYDAIEADYNRMKTIRYLKKVNLWEISLVTFPMNTRARITNVKSTIKEACTERELERSLRDVGISVSDSKYIVSLCKSALRDSEKPEEKETDISVKEILSSLQKTNISLEIARRVRGF